MRRRSLQKLAAERSSVSKRHRQVGKTGIVMFYDAKDVEVTFTDSMTGEKIVFSSSEDWEPPLGAAGVIIKT